MASLLEVCRGEALTVAAVREAVGRDGSAAALVDRNKRTALHWACERQDIDGALLDAIPGDMLAVDGAGRTPLGALLRNPAAPAAYARRALAAAPPAVLAAAFGSRAHALASWVGVTAGDLAGVDPAAVDADGCTALHVLCGNAACDAPLLAALLVDGRCDAAAADADGALPLHYLCANRRVTPECLTALLAAHPAAGAARDEDEGSCPLHVLASNESAGAAHVAAFLAACPAAAAVTDDAGAAAGADAAARSARSALRDDGFSRVHIDRAAAAVLGAEVSAVYDHYLARSPEALEGACGKIRTPEKRADVRASLTPKCRAVLGSLAREVPWLRGGLITQLSVVHSDPGAPAQTAHSDVDFVQGPATVFTVLVALSPAPNDAGPTRVWPKTHVAAFHALAPGPRVEALNATPPLALPLEAGGGVVIDARVFHRGGANVSERRRSLLSVTLQVRGGAIDDAAHAGTTDSLHPEYRGRYRLRDFLDEGTRSL